MRFSDFCGAAVGVMGRLGLVLLLLAGGQVRAAETSFNVAPGDVISFGGKSYPDFSSYFTSAEFQDSGMRCGTDRRVAKLATAELSVSQLRSTADCDNNLTQILQEYYPDGLHYSVPLWFHVIHKSDGTGNIDRQLIVDQVTVLNEDFRALAQTLGANGFDVSIEFTLAGADWIQNNSWFVDSGVSESAYKAALAKNPNSFTNVYINDARGNLGYAYLPDGSAGESHDGITMLYSVIGGRDSGWTPFDQGRTLVHEMGHYLGLEHVFTGGGVCANTYTGGDLIVDTNAQSAPLEGCPVASALCGSLDPVDNYMNYTDDTCMDKFTPEQGNRMVCSLLNYRSSLFTVVSPPVPPVGKPINIDPGVLFLLLQSSVEDPNSLEI